MYKTWDSDAQRIFNTSFMKTIALLFSCCLLFFSCSKKQQEEINTPSTNNGTEIPDQSIFNLTTAWRTEEAKEIRMNDLKGKVLVVVMIYTSCKVACPRLVADMRNIERQIPEDKKSDVQFVLVSIDPKEDTPERLKSFAIKNNMDDENWTFLQGDENSVREFSNVLSVKYKEIAPMDFSHSNIISVFNRQGELVHQQEGLGVDSKEIIDKIIATSSTH